MFLLGRALVLYDCSEVRQTSAHLQHLLQLLVILNYHNVALGVVRHVVTRVGRVGRVDARGKTSESMASNIEKYLLSLMVCFY